MTNSKTGESENNLVKSINRFLVGGVKGVKFYVRKIRFKGRQKENRERI